MTNEAKFWCFVIGIVVLSFSILMLTSAYRIVLEAGI